MACKRKGVMGGIQWPAKESWVRGYTGDSKGRLVKGGGIHWPAKGRWVGGIQGPAKGKGEGRRGAESGVKYGFY